MAVFLLLKGLMVFLNAAIFLSAVAGQFVEPLLWWSNGFLNLRICSEGALERGAAGGGLSGGFVAWLLRRQTTG
jgi:hypothetical protein